MRAMLAEQRAVNEAEAARAAAAAAAGGEADGGGVDSPLPAPPAMAWGEQSEALASRPRGKKTVSFGDTPFTRSSEAFVVGDGGARDDGTGDDSGDGDAEEDAAPAPGSPHRFEFVQALRRVFDLVDHDRDGRVDVADLLAALRGTRGPVPIFPHPFELCCDR